MIKKVSSEKEVIFILDNLRYEDKKEVQALLNDNWKEKTIENLKDKDFLVLYGKDNKGAQVPIAMGGFEDLSDDNTTMACVWLLCTYFIEFNKGLLMKELYKQIKSAESKYSIMYNYIYHTNYQAKKWLRQLGFCFSNPKPVGLDVKEGFEFFYKISKRREI